MITAPDFGRAGYPSRGERIGPCWQALWDALSARRGEWADADKLAGLYGSANTVKPLTARNLLRGAVRAGLLEVSYRGAKRRAFYRRPA